jgi:CRP-like cAMP-binding protein
MEKERLRQAIQSNAIFKKLPADQIEFLLQNGQERHFGKGQKIFAEGQENATTFCMIVSGRVEILKEDRQVIRSLACPESLGEIGPINPQHKRLCNVVAGEPTDVLEWDMATVTGKIPTLEKEFENLAWTRIVDFDQG